MTRLLYNDKLDNYRCCITFGRYCMLSAIQELANGRRNEEHEHLATLTACNLLFEKGILSDNRINSVSSPALVNMEHDFSYFSE